MLRLIINKIYKNNIFKINNKFNLKKLPKKTFCSNITYNKFNNTNSIDNNKIFSFFNQYKIEYKERATGQIVARYCPFCAKPHKNKLDNQYTLNFKPNSGLFLCFRCGTHGNWYDYVGAILQENGYNFNNTLKNSTENNYSSDRSKECYLSYKASKEYFDKNKNNQNSYINYLTNIRGFDIDTLNKYNIGVDVIKYKEGESYKEIPSIFFPLYYYDKTQDKVEFFKYKNKGLGPNLKAYQKIFPPGLSNGYFGLNLLNINQKNNKNKIIIVTEGEYDAMSVYQVTKIPTISLPNGASNLPLDLKTILDNYDKVILWMDFDEAGQQNIQKFTEKIGNFKTSIVKPSEYCIEKGYKDANDLLKNNEIEHLKQLILSAGPLVKDNILTFNILRSSVKSRILFPNKYKGTPSHYFPSFNKVLKGLRKGELSIFTGPTGSGKTTFLCQYSLDFLISNIPTLWCSFEMKNEAVLTTMLSQFSNCSLGGENFDQIADSFTTLPLYFQSFFGSTELDKVLTTIEYAIYAFDVGHVVIDNLQFMMSNQFTGYSKFDKMDESIAKIRKLATDKNVHISLVIHPRKGEDGVDLDINSVFGTAKSTQEADNVIIIQNRDKYKLLDIKKNRYDGELGKIGLGFDKETKKYGELNLYEIQNILEGKNIKEILKLKGIGTGFSEHITTNLINKSEPEISFDEILSTNNKSEDIPIINDNIHIFLNNDNHNNINNNNNTDNIIDNVNFINNISNDDIINDINNNEENGIFNWENNLNSNNKITFYKNDESFKYEDIVKKIEPYNRKDNSYNYNKNKVIENDIYDMYIQDQLNNKNK